MAQQQQQPTLLSNKVVMLFPSKITSLLIFDASADIRHDCAGAHGDMAGWNRTCEVSSNAYLYPKRSEYGKKFFFEVVVMLEMYTPRGVDFET